jgi:hypothetical protein
MYIKKLLTLSLIVFGFAILPSLAAALPITIVDELTQEDFRNNGYVKGFLGFGPHARLDYSHPGPDNTLEGGIFPMDDLISASLTITTMDDRDRAKEFGFVYTDGQWSDGGVLSIGGSHAFDVDLSQITDDGILDVTILALRGDFFVTQSVLTLTYDDGLAQSTAPVPEPGTLMLLGSGLIGLATMLRSRKRS